MDPFGAATDTNGENDGSCAHAPYNLQLCQKPEKTDSWLSFTALQSRSNTSAASSNVPIHRLGGNTSSQQPTPEPRSRDADIRDTVGLEVELTVDPSLGHRTEHRRAPPHTIPIAAADWEVLQRRDVRLQCCDAEKMSSFPSCSCSHRDVAVLEHGSKNLTDRQRTSRSLFSVCEQERQHRREVDLVLLLRRLQCSD